MRLAGDLGQSFKLTLARFEPPDRKWLVVVGDVDDGARRWRFEDPCLTTTEARHLAEWLRRVADGKTNRFELDFLEPNLAFEVVGRSGPRVAIRVAFELEARPPWNDRALGRNDDWRSVWLEFLVAPEQLREAADELRAQLSALER
jgi:hypothetical protein